MRRALLLLLVLAAVGALSCSRQGGQPKPADGRIRAVVSILPEAFFVERVGGQRVEVTVLVGPGQDPHTFEPSPRQVVALADAQVYFCIGIPFEKTLLKKVAGAFAGLRLVDVAAGIERRSMSADGLEAEEHDHEAAGHGEEGPEHAGHQHEAGEADPHVWLNPRNGKLMAAVIAEELSRLDPAHRAEYQTNLRAVEADLDALDARLSAALAPLKGRAFYVFHPAFGYFADAYGLKQAPVEIEGKEPTARQLAALVERARRDGVKVIFVQPQFPRRAAEVVAKSIGGAVVPIDDLAQDYISNLEEMAGKVQEALRPAAMPLEPRGPSGGDAQASTPAPERRDARRDQP